MQLEDIKLGQRVKDNLSQIEGVITARCDHISGYTQFVVQAPSKDGVIPEAFAVDWQAFALLDEENVGKSITPERHEYQLGDTVYSIDTGAKGVVTRLWTYFNGCVHASITLPLNSKGEPQDQLMAPVVRIKKVKKAEEAVKPRRTAGPPTRAPRP